MLTNYQIRKRIYSCMHTMYQGLRLHDHKLTLYCIAVLYMCSHAHKLTQNVLYRIVTACTVFTC